jgi:thiol-disulfide isomerase/thioredoxin
MRGGPPLPPLEIPSPTKPSEKLFPVDLAYFYQKGCPKCDRANVLLKYLVKKYPRLNVKEIDLNISDGKRLDESLSNRLNLPAEKRLIAPSIFIGNDYLSPEEISESKVEALIQKYEKIKAQSVLKVEKGEVKEAEKSMVDRFKSLGLLTIVSPGLIDGINPCAFATLIFFISYLFLYNFMFIVPLLVIFAVVYWGATSEQLACLLRKETSPH